MSRVVVVVVVAEGGRENGKGLGHFVVLLIHTTTTIAVLLSRRRGISGNYSRRFKPYSCEALSCLQRKCGSPAQIASLLDFKVVQMPLLAILTLA